MRVAVLFGGPSPEHQISILSAHQVLSAIDVRKHRVQPVYVDRLGQWFTGDALWKKGFTTSMLNAFSLEELSCDVALPVFHGTYGEDGVVQAQLEARGIPIAGCGHLASAVAMDKALCKRVVGSIGIPVLPDLSVHLDEARKDPLALKQRIETWAEAFPLFVKPRRLGSSIGIALVERPTDLLPALANGFSTADELLVEPCIEQLMEINIAVLNGKASAVEVPVPTERVLTYEDKYERGGKGKGAREGMASLTRVIDPCDLDSRFKEKVKEHALAAFDLLGCKGCVRFDFMMDTATDTIYFNELNPIPGSLSFYLWEKGENPMLFTHVLDQMLESAVT